MSSFTAIVNFVSVINFYDRLTSIFETVIHVSHYYIINTYKFSISGPEHEIPTMQPTAQAIVEAFTVQENYICRNH